MDRSEYLTKVYAILDDPQLFCRMDTDTTLLSEERLTIHLRRMKKTEFISEEECSLARPVVPWFLMCCKQTNRHSD